MSDLVLMIALGGRCSDSHFSDDEVEVWKNNRDLSKVIQLLNGSWNSEAIGKHRTVSR